MDTAALRSDASISHLSSARSELALSELRTADDADSQREAAKSFESLLATMLVREMRRALPEGFFGGGAGADVYEAWFDEHVGRSLTEGDALGLAGMVKTSIGRAQADQEGGPA